MLSNFILVQSSIYQSYGSWNISSSKKGFVIKYFGKHYKLHFVFCTWRFISKSSKKSWCKHVKKPVQCCINQYLPNFYSCIF